MRVKQTCLLNCLADNFPKSTIAIRFNLLQVCPSVSLFVLDVLFTLLFYFVFFFYSGYFCCTRFCGGSHTLNFGTPRDIAPLSLSSNVFERRTSTGNERFSLLMYRDAAKFVLLSVFTLKETFCPRTCSKSRLRSAKNPLPFDVRRSKMPWLKPHNN